MKFSLFTEVQCPPGSTPLERLNELLEQARLADELGYYGLWIAEIHFQQPFSLLSAPYPVLGAISQTTRRLRLGVAVNLLSVHHPLHLAEEAAMLDLLSHGRVDFALGRGHPHTRVFEGFEVDPGRIRSLMEESLKVILAAWTQERLEFEGEFYKIPEIAVSPKPLQRPHPPVYTANSSLDGVEFTARLGLNLLLPIHTLNREQVRNLATAYWELLEKHGHDRSRRELGLLTPVHLAETTDKAREQARDGFMDYYRVIRETRQNYQTWLASRGVDASQRLRPAPWEGMTFERMCAEHAIIGDSNMAAEEIRRLSQETGATHFLSWMNMGSIPHRLVLDSMQRYTRDVIARLDSP
jgi:alkanesulfonate monooxygenase SsuD/methylene tetrahydromethanopterin reductase-like flavin-dependent oxidoreductase (luciferase family)